MKNLITCLNGYIIDGELIAALLIYTRYSINVENLPSTADDRFAFNMFMKSRLDMLRDNGFGVTSNEVESNADTNAATDIRVEPNVDQREGDREGRGRGGIIRAVFELT